MGVKHTKVLVDFFFFFTTEKLDVFESDLIEKVVKMLCYAQQLPAISYSLKRKHMMSKR